MPHSWFSYDSVAASYASSAEPVYFSRPAEDLISFLRPGAGTKLLDVGTGSGAIAEAAARLTGAETVVACDLSLPMLVVARRRARQIRTVAADLTRLPFSAAAYDAVSVGFVLSHLPNPIAALQEIRRVLTSDGKVGVTSWNSSAPASAAGERWRITAERYVQPVALEEAVATVLPSESLLATQEGLQCALAEAGFGGIVVRRREYSVETTTNDFIESRLMSAPARYIQAQLPPALWDDFIAEISRDIRDHFGERVAFRTSVNFGIGITS